MKLSIQFKWFDLWIGAFIDRPNKIIYICPLPCVVLKITYGTTQLPPPIAPNYLSVEEIASLLDQGKHLQNLLLSRVHSMWRVDD